MYEEKLKNSISKFIIYLNRFESGADEMQIKQDCICDVENTLGEPTVRGRGAVLLHPTSPTIQRCMSNESSLKGNTFNSFKDGVGL